MLSPLKVAIPVGAFTVLEPERVAPAAPVFAVIDAVTEADDDVITLP